MHNFTAQAPELIPTQAFSSPEPTILLAFGSNTGSPRFTDFPSNLANLIGGEYETNTLCILRKLDPARALDPCHRPEG